MSPSNVFSSGPSSLREAIERDINVYSAENGSNTPDFILAEYLIDCLASFDKAVKRREEWYGRADGMSQNIETDNSHEN